MTPLDLLKSLSLFKSCATPITEINQCVKDLEKLLSLIHLQRTFIVGKTLNGCCDPCRQ